MAKKLKTRALTMHTAAIHLMDGHHPFCVQEEARWRKSGVNCVWQCCCEMAERFDKWSRRKK